MEVNAIDFKIGVALAHADLPFSALLAAALMRADSLNAAHLRELFPQACQQVQDRYNAPGAILDVDLVDSDIGRHELATRAADVAASYLKRVRP